MERRKDPTAVGRVARKLLPFRSSLFHAIFVNLRESRGWGGGRRAVSGVQVTPQQTHLVSAVEGADQKGDLLHDSQVLLQILQFLKQARGSQVNFI